MNREGCLPSKLPKNWANKVGDVRMKRIAVAVLLGAMCVSGPLGASESADGRMIERGQGINAPGKSQTSSRASSQTKARGERKKLSLAGMLDRVRKDPKATVTEVEYTRAWIDSRPKASGDAQFQCLAEALYFEARGETVKGQFAVAEVIVNRAQSSLYPDTVCGVIHQGAGNGKYRCQFTYKCDGYSDRIKEQQAYDRVAKVAQTVLDGHAGDLTDGALYYHTKAVSPSWSRRFIRTATIGVHYFYRRPDQRASNE